MINIVDLLKDVKSSFIRSDLAYLISRVNFRRFKNIINAYVARKTGKFIGTLRPVTLFIEIVNGCNFSCIGCQAGVLFKRSFMSFENFKKILDEFDDATFVYPYGVGESFLHRDIYKMLNYAVRKGFVVLPFTNFSTIDVGKLIDSGVRKIFASIDAFDRETFSKLRKRGSIDIVVKNLKNLQEEKRRRRTSLPEISINCTVMKENIDQVQDIVERGLKLGIRSFYFQTLYTADFLRPSANIPDEKDIAVIKSLRKLYKNKAKIYLISHYDYERGDYFSGFCQFAYSTLFISVDGGTYPCICGTTPEKRCISGVFGNFILDGVDKVISERTRFLRGFRVEVPDWCCGCPIYYRDV